VHIIVYTLYIYMHSTEPYMFLEARMRDINFVITPEVCRRVCVCVAFYITFFHMCGQAMCAVVFYTGQL